jgi:hypothetical protein
MDVMKDQKFERVATIEREHIDTTERTVPIAISSENPVDDWWGTNVLVHSKKAIDLSRGAEHGFPLLWRHGDEMLGRVKSIKLGKDKVLRGVAHFGNSDIAREKWQDVVDGVLTDISVGGSLKQEPERQEDGSYITRKWGVNEVSFVPVPGDATVGVNREDNGGDSATTEGDGIMADEKGKSGGAAEDKHDAKVLTAAEFGRTDSTHSNMKIQEGIGIERDRRKAINDMFSPHSHKPDFVRYEKELIDSGAKVEFATAQILLMCAEENPQPLASDFVQRADTGSMDPTSLGHVRRQVGTAVAPGQDAIDKYMEGAEAALSVKAGLEKDQKITREVAQNEFYSMGMMELAREFLRIGGQNMTGLNSKLAVMGAALTRAGIIGHSTSDFSNLLENVAGKALLLGFTEAEETWQIWCRTGNLPDFRTSSRVNMSTFGDLDIVYENGEYKYGTFSDLKETLTLLTYGKLFNISRQALINDDTAAFSMIPRRMGAAANRKLGDLAYGVLTTNAALNQDSTALFHADHSNLVAPGSGAAPSVTTVEAAITAMALQTDPAGNTLNISPSYLLCPKALEFTSQAIENNQYDPAATAGTLTDNGVRGRFVTVADPRLDADDALQWYMAANQNVADTVEIAFLDGNQTPFLESQDGWKQDGIEYKVRIDAAAAALDFRGLYQNNGD